MKLIVEVCPPSKILDTNARALTRSIAGHYGFSFPDAAPVIWNCRESYLSSVPLGLLKNLIARNNVQLLPFKRIRPINGYRNWHCINLYEDGICFVLPEYRRTSGKYSRKRAR